MAWRRHQSSIPLHPLSLQIASTAIMMKVPLHPYHWIWLLVTILIATILSREKKTECDIDNFPGLLEQASQSCVVCEAVVHPTCFTTTIRKLSEYPSSSHDEVCCSGVCCNWHGEEGLDLEAIREEHSELVALLKKDLVKLTSTTQVRVIQRMNNESWQISKPIMVRRLVAAKFGAGVEQAAKPAVNTIPDKFCLLNCLFSYIQWRTPRWYSWWQSLCR